MSLLKASRFLLYIIPAIPFIVWAELSFPYVVPKVILFRVIIEIVFLLFLVLLAKDKARISGLRNSYFFWIFGSLLLVEFIAAIFGESFLFSFLGDLERMWGIFTVLHFFLFYFLLRIFFEEREWKIFFHVSLIASLLVSIYGIIQRYPDFFGLYLFEAGASRIPSTLGNPTYVAIYLLFNVAFALYYLSRSVIARGSNDPGSNPDIRALNTGLPRSWVHSLAMTCIDNKIKLFYIAVIIIDFYAFTLTDIRGAYLGMILGIGFSALLYIFLGKRKTARIGISALAIIGIVSIALAFSHKDSKFIKQIPILDRISTISLSDGTVKTRFIGWNAAYQGFKESPFFGVGMENYNIVFDKFYPAEYYQYAKTETYFDRAHNQYLNILSESGMFALLLYLAFPFCIALYFIFGFRSHKLNIKELMIFSALAIAYFVHIFFAFDEASTLLMFSSFLAMLEFIFHKRALLQTKSRDNASNSLFIILLIIFVLSIAYAMLNFNIKTMQAAKISAQAFVESNNPSASIDYYNKSLSIGLIPSENIVIAFVDYLAGLSDHEEEIKSNPEELKNILAGFVQAQNRLENEIKKKPNDALLRMKLGYLNNARFVFDNDIEHLATAIKELRKAIDLSPERLQIYYILGESLVMSDQNKEAIKILEKAVEINPEFGASYYFLGRAYAADGQIEKGYEYMVNMALNNAKYPHAPQDKRILLSLSQTMAQKGDYEKVVEIYKYLIKFKFASADTWASLAAAYVQIGEYENAIQAAQKAASLDASFGSDANNFIQMIQDGKIEELKQATGYSE